MTFGYKQSAGPQKCVVPASLTTQYIHVLQAMSSHLQLLHYNGMPSDLICATCAICPWLSVHDCITSASRAGSCLNGTILHRQSRGGVLGFSLHSRHYFVDPRIHHYPAIIVAQGLKAGHFLQNFNERNKLRSQADRLFAFRQKHAHLRTAQSAS